jgi:hypothetical protein
MAWAVLGSIGGGARPVTLSAKPTPQAAERRNTPADFIRS